MRNGCFVRQVVRGTNGSKQYAVDYRTYNGSYDASLLC
jgi:hypothetical protein